MASIAIFIRWECIEIDYIAACLHDFEDVHRFLQRTGTVKKRARRRVALILRRKATKRTATILTAILARQKHHCCGIQKMPKADFLIFYIDVNKCCQYKVG